MTNPELAVRLTHRDSRALVKLADVYFTFASGRLAYDCQTCGSKCCRGHGYFSSVPEIERQLASNPSVRFFVEPPAALAVGWRVRNCAPACFFLAGDGQCEIHKMHGHRAKPETCRLFPFNAFLLVGEHLVVAPHQTLCPLSVVDAGESARPESVHEHLLAAMSHQGILQRVGRGKATCAEGYAAIDLERQIVAASNHHSEAEYLSFAATQLVLTSRARRGDTLTHDAAMNRIAGFSYQMWALLGTDAPVDDPQVVHSLKALTPLIRSLMAFRPADNAENWIDVEGDRIPRVLVALYGLALLARRAGVPAITFRSVTQMFHDSQRLLVLLAHADARVTWRPDVVIDLPFRGAAGDQARFIRIAKALLPRSGTPAPMLGELIHDHAPDDGFARVVFLKRLASRLVGRIALADPAPRTASPSLSLRQKAQRWALSRLSDEIVIAALHRHAGDAA